MESTTLEAGAKVSSDVDDSSTNLGDTTVVIEAADPRPPMANAGDNERHNASVRRAANSAKKRALLNVSASAVRRQQTLKANNIALARSLSIAKEEVKDLRKKYTRLKIDHQELKRQYATSHNNSLFDELVKEAVKTRILEIMGDLEQECSDATTEYNQLNNEVQQAAASAVRCRERIQRMGDLMKKHIDEAGEFPDTVSPSGNDGAANNRKTLAEIRRKTRANVEIPILLPPQGIREDATEAVRRMTTAVVILDRMDEDEVAEADVTFRKSSVNADEKRKSEESGPGAEAAAVVEEDDVPAAAAASRKTIGAPRKARFEDEYEVSPKRKLEVSDSIPGRRKTVAAQHVARKMGQDSDDDDNDSGPFRQKVGAQKADGAIPKKTNSRRKTTKADTLWEPPSPKDQQSENKKPSRAKSAKSGRSAAAVQLEEEDDEETQVIPKKSTKQKPSDQATKASSRSRKEADDQQRSLEGHDSERVGDSRPRRRTAAVSYKEPSLHSKIRRMF